MLNAEKYRDEILVINGKSEVYNARKVLGTIIGIEPDCILASEVIKWLLSEYQEPPILDKVEREYLSAFCRPYKIVTIRKRTTGTKERQWLDICTDNVLWNSYEYIHLPYFNANTMYKGMEVGKYYTPQELGITCKNNPNGEIKHENS